MIKLKNQTEGVKGPNSERIEKQFAVDDWRSAAEIPVRSKPVRSDDDFFEPADLTDEQVEYDEYERRILEQEMREMDTLDHELREKRVRLRVKLDQHYTIKTEHASLKVNRDRIWRIDTGEEITGKLSDASRAELIRQVKEKYARGDRSRLKKVVEGIVANPLHLTGPENARWLWPGYIPAGKVTILAGDPGMGKSTIALDIIARITRGTFLPCSQNRTPVGDCSIATAEDDDPTTVVPRLIAAGADRSKAQSIREAEIDDKRVPLKLPRDYEKVRAYIRAMGLRLLVIDPLAAFMEKGTDSYKDIDMRGFLAPMEEIAEETDCSILIIAHLNKKEDASSLYRIGGSIGFIAAPRSVLAVMTRAEDGQRLLYSLKCNLAKKPLAIEYSIHELIIPQNPKNIHTSKIEWLSEIDFDPMRAQKARDPESEAARQFWKQILVDGEMPTLEIQTEAKRADISWGTLKRVKYDLGITSEKRGEKWYSVPPKKWKK